MKINKISFKDNIQNWELSETSFDRLTLLVGASGVGKTKILRAINTIKRMALGRPSKGIEWNIDFTTDNNDNYTWSGKTNLSGDSYTFFDEDSFLSSFDEKKSSKTSFEKETIYLNSSSILDRTATETIYNGRQTVKFSLDESIVSILKEEDLIKPIVEGFNKIKIHDHSSSKNSSFQISILSQEEQKQISLDEIRNNVGGIVNKLYLISLYHQDIFEEIKDRYIEIFPLVENIKIEEKELELSKDKKYLATSLFLKEKGVAQWIKESDISSGMYRSLIHIAEMHLCPNGSIFLIDEFENSLGVNCIDELTNEILLEDRDIQFIITSHHPYIINNIKFPHWKLVTRKGSLVNVRPITDLLNGDSSHDKFMQLIQLSPFLTGEA